MTNLIGWDRTVAENLAILHSELAMTRQVVSAMVATMTVKQRNIAIKMIEEYVKKPPKFAAEAFSDPDRATQFQTVSASFWISILRPDPPKAS